MLWRKYANVDSSVPKLLIFLNEKYQCASLSCPWAAALVGGDGGRGGEEGEQNKPTHLYTQMFD